MRTRALTIISALLVAPVVGCGDDTSSETTDGSSSGGETETTTSTTTTSTTTTTTSTTDETSTSTTTDATSTTTDDTEGTEGTDTIGTTGTGTTGAAACAQVTVDEIDGLDIGVPTVTTDTVSVGVALDPDLFRIEFYDDTLGSFDLTVAPEDNYATCNKCVRVFEDIQPDDSITRQYFQSEGTLTISNMAPSSLGPTVQFEGVRLVEVTIDGAFNSTPVPDGQCIEIVDGTVTATPPVVLPEDCGSGMDEDEDGSTDCGDPDCAADMDCTDACMMPTVAMLGSNAGDTTNGTNLFQASCNLAGGLEEIWEYTAGADGLTILTLESVTDQGMSVRTGCPDAGTEVTCTDAFFNGEDEETAFGATNGTAYTIIVDGFASMEEGPYNLIIEAPTLSGEVEPNDTEPTANGIVNDGATGTLPMGDEDWYAVTVGQGGSIEARTFGQAGACDGDTLLELFDPTGTILIDADDNSGPGACSRISDSFLASGVYHLRVTASAADVDYSLVVEVN